MVFVMIIAAMHGASAFRWPGATGGFMGWTLQMQAMTGVAAVMTVVQLPMAFVVRRRVVRQALDRGTSNAEAMMGATILAAALVESFGLFGAVVCLLAGSLIPNVIFPLVSVGAIIALMPRSHTARELAEAAPTEGHGGFGEPQKWR